MRTSQAPVLPDIRISAPSMTPTLAKIADFVVANPAETTRLSVEELAEQAGVSVASIYRFCRQMQYQTFSHLKLAIARELSSGAEVDAQSDQPGELGQIFRNFANCVHETSRFLDPQALEGAVDLIMRSQRIMMTGVGASGIAASFLHYKLQRAGVACHRPQDMHLATMLASSFGPRDLMIVFSASGSTRDIVDLCTLGRDAGTPILAITSRRQNRVEEMSTFHLVAVSSDSPVTSGSGASVISQVALADCLYQTLYQRDSEVRQRVDATSDTIITKHF